MSHNQVYFDNASTTTLNSEVKNTYFKLLDEYFENSESLYSNGVKVHQLVEKSRVAVASILKVEAKEILFTSCASEANSLAIKGIAFKYLNQNKHLITTKVEHSSVLNAFKQLEELFGFDVTYLDVDKSGCIDYNQLVKAIRPETILVSIMYVNNEVGSINQIDKIKKYIKKESNAFLHVDCVQAIGKIAVDLSDIDLASISAHKLNGLKGSAILMKRKHIKLVPLISGGQQELNTRGGTSNACANIVFAKTLRLALEQMHGSQLHCAKLKEYCVTKLSEIEGISINSSDDSVVNILNISCANLYSEVMMNALNQKNICISAQSTCHSKSNTGSYVLKCMGYSEKISKTCIRLSFCKDNTLDEIDYFINSLKEIIKNYGTNI